MTEQKGTQSLLLEIRYSVERSWDKSTLLIDNQLSPIEVVSSLTFPYGGAGAEYDRLSCARRYSRGLISSHPL